MSTPRTLLRLSALLILTLVSSVWSTLSVQASVRHVIMLDRPAAADGSEWERRSLPIGNGSIGASIHGSVATERIHLNEKTLWMGGPAAVADHVKDYWDVNRPGAQALPAIRKAFTQQRYDEAARLTRENFTSPVPYTVEPEFRFGCFTTLGQLLIDVCSPEDAARITNYRRTLDIDSALVRVEYDLDGAHYCREAFCSYPDNVMVLRFTTSGSGTLNPTLHYQPNPQATGELTEEGDITTWAGHLNNNHMQFCLRIQRLAGEHEVTYVLTADTDYKPNYKPSKTDPYTYVGVDPIKTTQRWLTAAAKRGYKSLLKRHLKDYFALYNRVELNLTSKKAKTQIIPTDSLLRAYRQGQTSTLLEETYYQYGRYLLIASSRPGNLPANLQGIWAQGTDGPWHIDYHNNINLQMNYWPALTTNLTECQEPLTRFIDLLRVPGRDTARQYFGARGWAAGISANPFGFTAPLSDPDMSWNYNPMAAAWLTTHLWEQYEFTRNINFLRKEAYPVLKEQAQFTCDFLWHRPDDIYTAAPSTSPEHGPIDDGATFQNAVAREILSEAIQAAKVLNVDQGEAERWQQVLNKILPYKIGSYGQIQEWSRDIDDPSDQHRHVNHLFGLHPGTTISPVTTPELAQAARVVLEHRGDGATGWSMGWKLNQWARLHDGNHSYTLYQNLLQNGTADNLWDMHPPFQIDGNFGGTAGVTEMLLQSHAGFIHLLPALPDAWSEGSVSGLLARGAFQVSISWKKGRLQEAVIQSLAGSALSVRYGDHTITVPTQKGKTYHVKVGKDGKLQL